MTTPPPDDPGKPPAYHEYMARKAREWAADLAAEGVPEPVRQHQRDRAREWLQGMTWAAELYGSEMFPLLVRAAAEACHPWCETYGFRIRSLMQRAETAGERLAELLHRVEEVEAGYETLIAELGYDPREAEPEPATAPLRKTL